MNRFIKTCWTVPAGIVRCIFRCMKYCRLISGTCGTAEMQTAAKKNKLRTYAPASMQTMSAAGLVISGMNGEADRKNGRIDV